MAGMDDFFNTLGSGINLAGQVQGISNANSANQQVQSSLGQNSSTLAQQIQALQDQINQGRTTASDAYNQANSLYGQQNQELEGNIATMTNSLNALSDPNSAYMKQARTALERKDAASGRRSQWGDREVQLAAMLADYVGKYSPGLNNSITGARNQITSNQNSLAQLYAQMNNAGSQQQASLNDLVRQQQALAQAQNTTGRQAANANTNNTTAALQSALGVGKGLYNLFGGGVGGDTGQTLQQATPDYGGYGSGITGGMLGSGSLGGFGTGADANNYLGGGNIFGDYGSGVSFGSGSDVWDF